MGLLDIHGFLRALRALRGGKSGHGECEQLEDSLGLMDNHKSTIDDSLKKHDNEEGREVDLPCKFSSCSREFKSTFHEDAIVRARP